MTRGAPHGTSGYSGGRRRGRWQDQYSVGQTVEFLVDPQCDWWIGRIIRKTRTGYPVVRPTSGELGQEALVACFAIDRKRDIRTTDRGPRPAPKCATFVEPSEVGIGPLQDACREQLEALGLYCPTDDLWCHEDVQALLDEARGAACAFSTAGLSDWHNLAAEAARHLSALSALLRRVS